VHDLTIQSHRGPYSVHFGPLFEGLRDGLQPKDHLIIDAKVAGLYSGVLAKALSHFSVLKIEASESNKSLEKIPEYVTHLLDHGVKRDHQLICVGGGIVQDITAFMATCLLRGVAWEYHPTTLLAQADSCIGSKSSINVGPFKNQVGTYTPPSRIHVSMDVLDTLSEMEMRSGIGEMIKVHVIGGWNDTKNITKGYPQLLKNKDVLAKTLFRSLEIKKEKIEIDEFDKNERLVMNFGHTFGHAIEGATNYAVPHGIAVTLGMEIANFFSLKLGFIDKNTFEELHHLNSANYKGYENVSIPEDRFFESLKKDKKNIDSNISMILHKGPGTTFIYRAPFNQELQTLCREAMGQIKGAVAV